jgi:hypothetical protein
LDRFVSPQLGLGLLIARPLVVVLHYAAPRSRGTTLDGSG